MVYKKEDVKEVFAGLQKRNFLIGKRVHIDDITSIAAIVSALSKQEKLSPKLPEIVYELVKMSNNGNWGSTQANSLALLAIHDYIMEKKICWLNFQLQREGTETLQIDPQKGVASINWSSAELGVLKLVNWQG
jgi:hypothetical protein